MTEKATLGVDDGAVKLAKHFDVLHELLDTAGVQTGGTPADRVRELLLAVAEDRSALADARREIVRLRAESKGIVVGDDGVVSPSEMDETVGAVMQRMAEWENDAMKKRIAHLEMLITYGSKRAIREERELMARMRPGVAAGGAKDPDVGGILGASGGMFRRSPAGTDADTGLSGDGGRDPDVGGGGIPLFFFDRG